MPDPVIVSALAGCVLGTSGGDFVIAEWQDPGGPPGPPRLIAPPHIHHSDDEAWYVLEGTLRVRVGDEVVEAKAGAGIFVPRRTIHTYWNPGPGSVRYLLVMTGRIHQLIQEIHAMESRTPENLRAVFRKYDSDLAD